jgi:hypothetical protein
MVLRGTLEPSGTGESVSDQRMVGKVGRCTGSIGPGKLGEVMVPIRGGSEAFHAYATEKDTVIEPGTRIVVVEYHPPRTVVVTTI